MPKKQNHSLDTPSPSEVRYQILRISDFRKSFTAKNKPTTPTNTSICAKLYCSPTPI